MKPERMTGVAKDLGKQLDAELRSAGLPQLMKGHGYTAKRGVRRWRRDIDKCRQVAAVDVDGRSAPDGYLVARLECGLRFDGEQEVFEIGGEYMSWSLHPLSQEDNQWRFDAEAIGQGVGGEIVRRMASDVLPLLDRLRDRRAARDYFLEQGQDLTAIRELSLAIGDLSVARAAAHRDLERFVAALKGPNPPMIYAAQHMLQVVSELDLDISAEDLAALERGARLT